MHAGEGLSQGAELIIGLLAVIGDENLSQSKLFEDDMPISTDPASKGAKIRSCSKGSANSCAWK